jgi:cytochrome c peroxidase
MSIKAILFFLFIFVAENTLANLDDQLNEIIEKNELRPLVWKSELGHPLFQLGEKLFKEKEISGNKNISCQTCHHPDFGSSDGLPLPIGEGGEGEGPRRRLSQGSIIPRHAPHVFNNGFPSFNKMFWDGRVSYNSETDTFTTPAPNLNKEHIKGKNYVSVLSSALAAQAMFPPLSHEEMRGAPGSNEIADASDNFSAWEKIMERLLDKELYQKLFRQAFQSTPLNQLNFAHAGEALGFYQSQRFAVTDTPFDRYIAGQKEALNNSQKRGMLVFYGKGKCSECHQGMNFTDQEFHNVAFPQVGPGKEEGGDDRGLFLLTGKDEDLYRFKTPGLRNVSRSAPYGHSGSLKTLNKVIEHYNHPMRSNHHYESGYRNLPYALPVNRQNMNNRLRKIDPILNFRGIGLTQEEQEDLLSFIADGLTQEI